MAKLYCEPLRLIEVGASCFVHHCVLDTRECLHVLHDVCKR